MYAATYVAAAAPFVWSTISKRYPIAAHEDRDENMPTTIPSPVSMDSHLNGKDIS
jgi:hypothetical protein